MESRIAAQNSLQDGWFGLSESLLTIAPSIRIGRLKYAVPMTMSVQIAPTCTDVANRAKLASAPSDVPLKPGLKGILERDPRWAHSEPDAGQNEKGTQCLKQAQRFIEDQQAEQHRGKRAE